MNEDHPAYEVRPVPGGWALHRIERGQVSPSPLAVRPTPGDIEFVIAHLAQSKRVYSVWGERLSAPPCH